MGDGTTSSHRWQTDRQTTLAEQVTYWQDKALQLRSERDQLLKTCERLARKLGQAEQTLEQYGRAFESHMFHTPNVPEPFERREPFSQ